MKSQWTESGKADQGSLYCFPVFVRAFSAQT